MLEDDLNLGLGAVGGVRFSNNVALSLSRKVTEVQREIVHQLRTEAIDHTRAETPEKEPDKGRAPGKRDDREELSVQPDGDVSENTFQHKQQLNITV